MKISKNSWHYRLVRSLYTSDDGDPKSLCEYFLAVVLSMLFASTAIVVCTSFFIYLPYLGFRDYTKTGELTDIAGGLAAYGIVGLIFLLVFIAKTFKRKDSLILNYLKAKKDKICPLIEYTDEQ